MRSRRSCAASTASVSLTRKRFKRRRTPQNQLANARRKNLKVQARTGYYTEVNLTHPQGEKPA